jgi:hypothetical protein
MGLQNLTKRREHVEELVRGCVAPQVKGRVEPDLGWAGRYMNVTMAVVLTDQATSCEPYFPARSATRTTRRTAAPGREPARHGVWSAGDGVSGLRRAASPPGGDNGGATTSLLRSLAAPIAARSAAGARAELRRLAAAAVRARRAARPPEIID